MRSGGHIGLKGFARSVSRDEGAGRLEGESWPAMLRRWLVECPRCAQVWLVVGARENDRHVCKSCGHGFIVTLPAARSGVPADLGQGTA